MESFNDLLVAEIPRLRRYAAVLTKRGRNMEDLIQSTLVRALEKQHLWEPGTNFRAWAFCIMHNCFVSELRSKTREQWALKNATLSVVALTQPQNHAPESGEEIELAFNMLSPEVREALLLCILEGLSYRQACARTRVAFCAFRSRLHRGRKSMRTLLQGTCAGELGHCPKSLRERTI